jgi:hypothetical protein
MVTSGPGQVDSGRVAVLSFKHRLHRGSYLALDVVGTLLVAYDPMGQIRHSALLDRRRPTDRRNAPRSADLGRLGLRGEMAPFK